MERTTWGDGILAKEKLVGSVVLREFECREVIEASKKEMIVLDAVFHASCFQRGCLLFTVRVSVGRGSGNRQRSLLLVCG
jgi:hypothetical protein